MRTTRTPIVASLVTIAALALGACSSGGASEPADSADSAPATTVASVDTTTTTALQQFETSVVEPVEGMAANSDHDLAVYSNIDDPAPTLTLPAQTSFGSRRVLAVVGWQGPEGEWLEVLLPERPNGSRGFVRTADVTLSEVDYLVDVDLGARHLRLLNGENVLIETPIAVGSEENPTPTGDFYLTDILITGDDGSAYGPYALGVSAHSNTLSDFGGGDGQIGIHGTNQPSSIGQAVSHGCVRVPNEVVTALANTIPLGTPVVIH